MMLFGPMLLLGLVILAVWFVRQQERQRTASGGTGPAAGNALSILRERYARGEISREEFERMRRDLEGGPGTA